MSHRSNLLKLLVLFMVPCFGSHRSTAQTAVISGIDKLHKRTPVLVTRWNPTFDARYQPASTIAHAHYQNDSVFTLVIPATRPVSVDFQMPSRGFAHKSWVSPNDSLRVEIDRNADYPFYFSGEHAFHYNVYRQLKSWEDDLYSKDIQTFGDFKSAYQGIGHAVDSLLEGAAGDPMLSASFADVFKEEIKAKYIADLTNFMRKFGKQDQSLAMQEIRLQHVELANDDLLSSRFFTLGLTVPLPVGKDSSLTEMEEFERNIDYVDEHFENRIREFLLGSLAAKYSGVFSDKPPTHKLEYTSVTQKIASQITDTVYKQWVLGSLDYVNKLNQQLPDKALNAVLTDDQGNELSMRQILDAHKGRYLLIDIWASWCVPCLAELEHAGQTKSKLYFTV
ncbi:hypothetical protein SAMN05660226_01853 [Parapedobacter luteus]|uniref:AhpC/TSA family protein n=1 Tax=Parapedobacter luteus TaxID=623280 RepID=A0A1T5C4W6_9SPHI|nr:hypothetical protein [Parapedobacter luteus]SKB54445.1 hypothetical protein SAMN05660226_01853 [Parapedobacter luteus]